MPMTLGTMEAYHTLPGNTLNVTLAYLQTKPFGGHKGRYPYTREEKRALHFGEGSLWGR